MIDVLEQGTMTINDGNTARFFENPHITIDMTGLIKSHMKQF